MNEPEFIDPNQLQPGPIRRESLSLEMHELVAGIYDVLGPYLNTTLDDFEDELLRDAHPEAGIASWCSITAAWLAYHDKYLDETFQGDEAEKKLLGALVLISSSVTDAEALGVPAEVGLKLLACYEGLSELD